MTNVPIFEPTVDERRPPSLASTRGELPLRAVAVNARIVGCTADVAVEQTFENVFDESVEVSYVFPLPDLAAVTRCELHVGGRVIAAKLAERGAARDTYAKAIEAGQRAALAEEERPGVFTITLGNLQPGELATVRFGMAYLLPREDGRHVFRFPLVVGERYVPGAAIDGPQVGAGTARDTTEVPDASRVSPPRLAPGADRPRLALEVTLVHGALGIDSIESSLHAIRDERGGDRTTVRLAPGQLLDRDFVLRFRIGGDALRTQLAVCRDPDPASSYRDAGSDATFQLVLVPPVSRLRTRPRDVVLLLDRSGSMAGWKIVAARRALARMIEILDDGDRFAVYAFGSEVVGCADLAFDRLHAATATNRARAAEMLAGMSAEGGTEMRQPLGLATALLGEADAARDRWIVLVTDGQVANEDALVALVERTRHAKVLALGIDDAVNSSLLRRLATATGGRVELVQLAAELEDALHRLHVLIATPVIERVAIEADGIAPGSIVPDGPLHVFPGVPLVVRGRCREPLGAVRVRGRIHGEPFDATVRAEPGDIPALRACWAREHLLALEDRFATDARAAIVDDIVATSLSFGVLCRFTAFVAVDTEGRTTDVAQRHVQQPVEPTLAIAPTSQIRATRWGSPPFSRSAASTRAGTLRGKLWHLSPEEARGMPLEPSHEVYALARLLYEMLSGRRLYRGMNDFEMLTAIIKGELPSPLVPAELASLESIVRRALATDPAQRYPRPGAFADAIEATGIPIATPADIAAWLLTVDPQALADQAAMLAHAAVAQPPVGGYHVLGPIGFSGEAAIFAAVRAGPEVVALARLHPHYAEDPDCVEAFLSEVALAIDGLARTDDAGVDHLGGVFRTQRFVPGLDLASVLRKGKVPAPIALAICCAAARALEAALDLPSTGAPVGMIVRDLAPGSLRIGVDGRPVWTSLGVAPSPDHTARRRLGVRLTMPDHISLERPSSPPLPAPWVSAIRRRNGRGAGGRWGRSKRATRCRVRGRCRRTARRCRAGPPRTRPRPRGPRLRPRSMAIAGAAERALRRAHRSTHTRGRALRVPGHRARRARSRTVACDPPRGHRRGRARRPARCHRFRR